jgi:cyclopropane fatty-acyl-phospholipid synthase-like methyltransferase
MADTETAGTETAGTEIAGTETAGTETAGTEIAGTEIAGTHADLPTSLTRLTFHGPLSEARAGRLVDRLTRARPATVLDIGCGWGELMLRILAVLPDATGLGLDTDEGDLARGRAAALSRGLSGRVTFVNESGVGTTRGPADLVLCIGSSHALTEALPPESVRAALAILRRLVTPRGRVLLGESFWHRTPTEAELAAMWPGITAEGLPDLAGLVDLAVGEGFRPAWIETATLEEWEDFESGYQCDEEEWLAAHAGHPDAARIRAQVDEHRSYWLRGYRGLLGQAYLTLVPAG